MQQLEQDAAAVLLLPFYQKAEVHGRPARRGRDRLEQAEHLALVIRGAASEQLAVPHRRLERRRGPLVQGLGRLYIVMPVDEQRRRAGHFGPDAPHHRVRLAREKLYLATAEPTQLTGDPLRRRPAVGVVRRVRRYGWDSQKLGELAQQTVGVHGAENLEPQRRGGKAGRSDGARRLAVQRRG